LIMEQEIRFCKTANGVRIAYTTVGKGPALVMVPGWVSHLQLQWEHPAGKAYLEKASGHRTLIYFDKHGCGLSERNREIFTLDSEVEALESVVDHLKLKNFALFGYSQSGPIVISYVVKHHRRVSHLILFDTYARGEAIATDKVKTAFLSLVRAHWGIGSQTLTDIFLPDAEPSAVQWFNQLQREATNSEMAAKLMDLTYQIDVTDLLSKIRIPTLVMHRRGDRAIPFHCGMEMAAMIPNARFVPLEGKMHVPFLGDSDAVQRVIAEFLGDVLDISSLKPDVKPDVQERGQTPYDATATEAHALITRSDEIELSRYRVVGKYTRYDEPVRNTLRDARTRITAGCLQPSRKRENFLIWAAPGSGKTYFAQQIAESLPKTIRYQEINLVKCGEQEFRDLLGRFDGKDLPCLFLIDECDAKPLEPWPYEILLPYLDASVEQGTQLVFILAGSGGESLDEMKKRIAARPKGPDLLCRIPSGNEYEIRPLSIGDRILVVLSQFREVGREFNREISSVEKLGLYYVALNPRLVNARQLREFAVRAIERIPPNEDCIKYDHLFSAGDPDNKDFWLHAQPIVASLVNSFTVLKD
jgi:pimeloyl-ACP methyl ester carboxylesterase